MTDDNPQPQTAFAANTLLLQPWTDLGLRMLDWMVSSSQQAGDRMERMARAGGPAETQELASHAAGTAAGSALAAATQWHGAALEWMTQAWQQWFDMLGAFSRMAAPAQDAAARGLQPAGGAAAATAVAAEAATAATGTAARASRRDSTREPHAGGTLEHAAAASPPRKTTRRRTTRAGTGKPRAGGTRGGK